MKEICYINSSLNIIAMILIVYYSVLIYIQSNFNKMDAIIYFIIVMTCSLRIGTEIHLIENPTNDTIEVFVPLIRNFAFGYVFYKLFKKSKS
jgi:hypothetical protein